MVPDFEQSKSPGGNDHVLSKLRHRLKEKETALEVGGPSVSSCHHGDDNLILTLFRLLSLAGRAGREVCCH